MKKIMLDEPLRVPKKIVFRDVDKHIIALDYEKPNWIITDQIGKIILTNLSSGSTLRESMVAALKNSGPSEDYITKKTQRLLNDIEKFNFYEDADIIDLDKFPQPMRMHLYLTNRCNLHCVQCYMDSGTANRDELNVDEWKHLIDEFSKIVPKTLISFSGGEPLVREDFFEIAKYAKQMGHETFLFTNGTLITKRNVEKLKDCIDGVQISIDGATAKIHDAVRGKGTFERSVNALKILRNGGIKVNIGCCIMPENIDDIEKNIIPFLKSLNIKDLQIGFSVARSLGRWKLRSACTDSVYHNNTIKMIYRRMRKVLKEIYVEDLGKPTFSRNIKKRSCNFAQRFTVSSTGDVYPCAELIHSVGNVRSDKVETIYNRLTELQKKLMVDNTEGCKTCELKYICRGGCKTYRYIDHKNIFKQTCNPQRKQIICEKLVYGDIR